MMAAIPRHQHLRRFAWRIGRKIYCASRGEISRNNMRLNGETNLQRCVIEAVPEGEKMLVLDIGANQGDWTIALLEQVPDRQLRGREIDVHAFEPVPATAQRFRSAVEAGKFDASVTLHGCGVSDAEGRATIALHSESGGTNSLHTDLPDDEARNTIEIDLTSVDAFLDANRIGHVHLVKCDTEGHDAKVLAGAAASLASGNIDIFQFEYNHRWVFSRSFLRDVFELVRGLPYSVIRVEPKGGALIAQWHPELERYFEGNYALVHDRALAWVALREGNFDNANTYA